MLQLLLLADDLTGAMDTGIKFADYGVATQFMIFPDVDFKHVKEDTAVLVIDTETRHLDPSDAYKIVYDLVLEGLANGIKYIYKKTDSALRGCLGSELTAVSDATGACVEFIPGMPSGGRTTINGIHYIEGEPLAESPLGHDPFNRVYSSYIPDIIGKETTLPCITVCAGEDCPAPNERSAIIYDSETEDELIARVTALQSKGRLTVMAGCAAFASYLPKQLLLPLTERHQHIKANRFLMLSGTLNHRTEEQIRYAQMKGFLRVTLSERQKWEQGYLETEEGKTFINELHELCSSGKPLILDVFKRPDIKEDTYLIIPENRGAVASRMVEIGEVLSREFDDMAILMTGGDTVFAFIRRLHITELSLVTEISPGLVLFTADLGNTKLQIISKAGGLGSEDSIVECHRRLQMP